MAGGRFETELKFLVRRAAAEAAVAAPGVQRHEITQVYLDETVVGRYRDVLGLPDDAFAEWRLRRMDNRCIFTAKGGTGLRRREFETEIDTRRFQEILDAAAAGGQPPLVRKTRYVLPAAPWTAEIDDYHETGTQAYPRARERERIREQGARAYPRARERERTREQGARAYPRATGAGTAHHDFLTCEVEFSDEAPARAFLAAGPGESLPLLEGALDLTGHAAFANRALARHGFPVADFDALAAWLQDHPA